MRAYERLTRLELMKELATLDDCFEAKVAEEVKRRCSDFQNNLDKFFEDFESDIDDKLENYHFASLIGDCAEYHFKGGYTSDTSNLNMLNGIPQYTAAISNDWPQKYFNFDKTGIGDKLREKRRKLHALIKKFGNITTKNKPKENHNG